MPQSRFGKNVLLVLLVLTVLSSVTYLLLFSTTLANVNGIVKLRMKYYGIADKARVTLGIPNSKVDNYSYIMSPIRVFGTNKSDSEYIYGFIGKLENIDLSKGFITLTCCREKQYVFRVELQPSKENPQSVTVIDVPTKTPIVFDTANFSSEKGRQISLIWKDSRRLNEILNTFKSEPSRPLNNNSEPTLILMTELKDK